MIKTLLALGAAAVVSTATPTLAARHYSNLNKCTKWRHGQCVAWKRLTRAQARRQAYRIGYGFGPNYRFTPYNSLPQPIVSRYGLGRQFRYVNRNGYVYVVNPRTYRVVRVIEVL